jgi:hypothetical protein
MMKNAIKYDLFTPIKIVNINKFSFNYYYK